MTADEPHDGRHGEKDLGGTSEIAVSWDARSWNADGGHVTVRVYANWNTPASRCFATVRLSRSAPEAVVSMANAVPNPGADEAVFRLRFRGEDCFASLDGDVPLDSASWFRGEIATWPDEPCHDRHHGHHDHHDRPRRREHDCPRPDAVPFRPPENPLDPTAPEYGPAPVAWGRIVRDVPAERRLLDLLTVGELAAEHTADVASFVFCPTSAQQSPFAADLDAARRAGDLAQMRQAAANALPGFESVWTQPGSPPGSSTYHTYPDAVRRLRARVAELNLLEFIAELAQLLGIAVDPFAPEPLADCVAAFDAYARTQAFTGNETLAWEIAFCGGLTAVPVALTADVADDLRCTGLVRRIARGAPGLADERERREALRAVAVLPAAVLPPQPFLPVGSPPLGSPPHAPGGAASWFAPLGVGEKAAIYQRLERYSLGEIAEVRNVMARERFESTDRDVTKTADLTTDDDDEATTRESAEDDTLVSDVRQELHDLLRRDGLTRNYTNLAVTPATSGVPYLVTVNGTWDGWSGEDRRDAAQSADLAKAVVSRSIERIESRVARTRASIRWSERERCEVREIDNREGTQPISGIYRWLQQRQRMTLRRLGRRLVVEFMLDHPAQAYLAELTSGAREQLLPPKPPAASGVSKPLDVTAQNARVLAASYGLEPLPLAAPGPVVVTASLDQGRWTASLAIPPGYAPATASVAGVTSDATASIVGTLGTTPFTLEAPNTPSAVSTPTYASPPVAPPAATPGPEQNLGQVPFSYTIAPLTAPVPGVMAAQTIPASPSARAIDVTCYSSAEAYRVSVEVTCYPGDAVAPTTSPAVWQTTAYEALVAAYQRSLRAYEASVAERIAASARAGTATVIERQLLLAAIAVFAAPDGLTDPALARCLLDVFEWSAMTYSFFPWATGGATDPSRAWTGQVVRDLALGAWLESFVAAGSARVLVPVRPGYELAALFALTYGAPWSGSPGAIPALAPYVAWLERLHEPHPDDDDRGEELSWHVTVPTALVALEREDGLPDFAAEPAAER